MGAYPFRIRGAQALASAPVAQVDRSTAVVDQLQGAAADIRREGEKIEAHRLKRTEEKERFGSLVGLQKFKSELAVENQKRLDGMDPGGEGFAARSMEFYDLAEEEYLATVAQSQKEAIQLRLGNIRPDFLNGVSSTERDENIRYQFETVKGTLNGYEQELRSNPGRFAEIKEQAFALIDSMSVPPAQQARLKGATQKQYGLSWAGGLSAHQKIAWFKSGGKVPAQFSENVSGLDAGDFAKIERAGETETRALRAEANARSIQTKEAYSLAIAMDPRGVDETTFLNDQRIDDGDKAMLKRSYDAAMKEDKEKFDALAAIDARKPVNGFDVKARKGLDQAYSAKLENLSPQQAAADITEKTGVTPKLYINELRSALVSEDPVQMEEAFQSSQKLLQLSPGAFAGAPGAAALIKDTRLFESLTLDMGYTSKQATQQISDARQRLKGSGGELLATKAAKLAKDYNADHITEVFDTIVTWEPELGFSKLAKQNAVADYRSMFRRAYQRLGDKALAEAEANWQLNKVYGSSDLFLDKRVVAKYAPEKFFPDIGGSRDYVREQAAAAAGVAPDKVFLVADDQTARDVHSVMEGVGQQVRYQLWQKLDDGTFARASDDYFAPDSGSAARSLRQTIKVSSEKLEGRAEQIMRDQEEAIHSINLGG